ncbi:DUF2341 domain-containing protein, partial [Patescibacteria group bacterium]|nr:DUF2341 domain-containing protein [Patescibacteria group bacterium]
MFKYLNINISKYRKKAEKKIALLIDIKNKNIKKWQKFSKKQKIQYAGAGFLILIALLSLSFYFFYNRSAEADWFDDGWHYRRKLTFNNASSTENLANFPVLVSLNSSRIDYSNTQDSGQDIRFTDPNGIILKYEIEEWNESGTSTVWVKIPQIDAGSTIDYIYMYYGNPDASDGQDMENVWDSDFKMVQHLQEASTSTDAYVDSTSNNYDGTATSSFAAANLDATGKIDGANDFDGTDDWIDIGASYDGVKTVEFWIEADNTTKDIIDLNGSAYISVSSGNATTTGFTSPTIYVNGVATTTIDTTWRYAAVTTGTGLNASDLDIGRREGGTYFDGIIDEVRISSAARSGEWIEAQYKSMTDTYITYGSEENQEGAIVVWHFNEGSGSVAYDDSNYDNDLSISGASWITGKFGNALSFDGDDVASTSDAASLDMGTQDWSISTWLKTSASATSTIIEKSGSSVAWLGTWSKRIEITASNTNVDNDLTQFPVLLKLGTSVGTNSADVSAVFDELQSDDNRTKIAVTKSDGTTELYVEIEKWDDANEQAVLWVSRSGWVLDADAPTTLYLYYDSSQADNTIYVGDVNSTPGAAVWDANYKGVYHLGEAVNTDAGGYKDSTSNNNDGTGVSMALTAPSAKIGIGQEFDGTADYITLPFTLATPYALEVWGKPDSLALGAVLLSQALTDTTGGGVAMGYYNTSNEILVGNNTLRRGLSGISTYLTAGTWQYWVDVVAANNNIIFYLDGVDKGTGTAVNYWSNDSGKATIAARCVGAAYSRFFDGSIDEVRISNTARSATWIKANYYTQTDGLVSWGSEEQKQGYKLEALASGVVRATIASATTTLTVDSSNTV